MFGPNLESAVDEKIPNNVKIEGYCSHEMLLEKIAESDVLIHPSYWENAPFSIREALALGTPIIAYDSSGTSELLQGKEYSILVPPGDLYSLKNAIESLSYEGKLLKLTRAAKYYKQKSFADEAIEIESIYNSTVCRKVYEGFPLENAYSKFLDIPYFQGFFNTPVKDPDKVFQFLQNNFPRDPTCLIFWWGSLLRLLPENEINRILADQIDLHFTNSLDYKKMGPIAVHKIGSIFKSVNRLDEATAAFEHNLENESPLYKARSLFHLGEIALMKSDLDKAHKLFTECFSLWPENKKLREYLDGKRSAPVSGCKIEVEDARRDGCGSLDARARKNS